MGLDLAVQKIFTKQDEVSSQATTPSGALCLLSALAASRESQEGDTHRLYAEVADDSQ